MLNRLILSRVVKCLPQNLNEGQLKRLVISLLQRLISLHLVQRFIIRRTKKATSSASFVEDKESSS